MPSANAAIYPFAPQRAVLGRGVISNRRYGVLARVRARPRRCRRRSATSTNVAGARVRFPGSPGSRATTPRHERVDVRDGVRAHQLDGHGSRAREHEIRERGTVRGDDDLGAREQRCLLRDCAADHVDHLDPGAARSAGGNGRSWTDRSTCSSTRRRAPPTRPPTLRPPARAIFRRRRATTSLRPPAHRPRSGPNCPRPPKTTPPGISTTPWPCGIARTDWRADAEDLHAAPNGGTSTSSVGDSSSV